MKIITRDKNNINGLTTIIINSDELLRLLKEGNSCISNNFIIIHEENK